MTRVYTIWPADRDDMPATSAQAWHQDTRWLVLDVTEGTDRAIIVEGPVSRATALRRELEIRVIARQTTRANRLAREAAEEVREEIR